MADSRDIFKDQLTRVCKETSTAWAACLVRSSSAWQYTVGFRMSKRRLQAIHAFLGQPAVGRWMAGALSSGRTRSRSTGERAKALACERVYIFPNASAQAVIMVGGSELTSQDRNIYRVLALGIPAGGFSELADQTRSLHETLEISGEVTYNFQDSMERVLGVVAKNLPGDAAYLAVRRGDILRIEAAWNAVPGLRGVQVSIDENAVLGEMAANGTARIVSQMRSLGGLIPKDAFPKPVRSWLGVPLVLGNRVIALLAFMADRRGLFSEGDLQRAIHFGRQITPFVENAIAFDEAGRHLQRLALLNELASAASAGLEIDRVAQRVLRMLRRTFQIERIALLLLSSDGKWLREYGDDDRRSAPIVIPVESTTAGQVVDSGLPLRLDDHLGDLPLSPEDGEVRSELAVPLKYRGRVVGVLHLGSPEPNAFSQEDEQLLVVIASHLAGLLENVRLSEESRLRARNLTMIHQVVQRVLGLIDVGQIAQLSAELMAERFSYEMATVLMLDQEGELLVCRGLGGSVPRQEVSRPAIPVEEGVLGRVLRTGKSLLANDVNLEGGQLEISGWVARSQMTVPLREGEKAFGLIDVENSEPNAFSENDLLVLESLAGFLSSVMMNARRYQQLQTNVRHLQAGRETALDIGADLDLDTLLSRVVNRTKELVGVKGAELGLLDRDAQAVQVLVSENPWNDYSGLTFPLMSGVAGQVAALGEPLVVNDYNTWSGKSQPGRQAPFNSVAGVPLKFKGEVIGTLTVYDDNPERIIGDQDVELLELVAPQVAVYIRHAQLFQELQKRIEAQQLAERRLIQSARLAAVGEMAAGIAHELNNPLTTVAGFAELVLDELEEDFPQRPDLELILREAVRARGVVRRLLDFSRQSESVRERANINDIVTDVVALVNHLARTSGVEVNLDLSEGLPLVYADSNQMKQVLLNFVHNALQAMPGGGLLSLETAAQERDGQHWVTVQIQDTGEGIPREHLGRIYEPFFTTKPTGSGTGLGLSISYGIISDHGGFIDVESEVGSGTEFTIWLSAEAEHVDA